MKALRLLLAVLIAAPASAFAANEGGRAGAFLDYAASARSLGMGQAFTGVANDPSAIYWNPSTTALLPERSLVAQFSTLAEQSTFGFVGYAQRWHERTGVGVGLVNLQSGSIPKRDATGNKTGDYQAASNALLLSGSYRASMRFSFGSTAKVIRESIDSRSGSSVGLDAGSLFRANEYLQVGLVIRNLVAPTMKLKNESETYERSAVVGLGITPIEPLTIGVDVEKGKGSSLRKRIGADYTFNRILAFRVGLNDAETTAGMGIGLGNWNFDYALGYARSSSEIRDLGTFQRFGLQLNFGAPAAPLPAPTSRRPTISGKRPAVPEKPKANQAALDALNALGEKMDNWDGAPSNEIQSLVNTVSKDLGRGRFLKPVNIYAAQGYVSYFTGEYARSVRSLESALRSDPGNGRIAARLKIAQDQNMRRSQRPIETPEIRAVRERFERGDYAGTVVLAQRLLESSPKDVNAALYLRRSLEHIVQPQIKKGKDMIDRDRFVDAFILFQKALDYDPDNADAKLYSERLVKVIEKQSDMDYLSRAIPKDDTAVQDGLARYERGLRVYAHGDTQAAVASWNGALPSLQNQPVLYDTVRSTIVELSR